MGLYLVKWLGYDDPADQTWEPVEHLAEVPDILLKFYLDRVQRRASATGLKE